MDVYRVTLSTLSVDRFYGIQLETDSLDGALVEHHHTFGFLSRPLEPTDEGECLAFGFDTGDETHALLSYDRRIMSKIPELPKGSSMVYGATGSYHLVDGSTGTQTIYVPYADNTKCQTIQASAEGITLIHGSGTSVILTDEGVTVRAPNGSTWFSTTNKGTAFSGDVDFAGNVTTSQPPAGADALAKITPLLTVLSALAAIIDAKTPATTTAAAAVTAYNAAIPAQQTMSVKFFLEFFQERNARV